MLIVTDNSSSVVLSGNFLAPDFLLEALVREVFLRSGPRGAAGDGIDVHQGTGSGVKLSLDADHKQTETGRGDQQQQTRDDDGKTQALHYCQSGRSSIVPGNSRGCNPRLQGGVILDDTFNLFLRTTTKNHH